MAVFRIQKTKDFTVMSNHHLRNTKLSLKAKGLLSLMLSLPEGWDYTTKGLAHICRDGVDSISTAIRELEQCGYLTRRRLRRENGQLGDIEYTIHERPAADTEDGFPPDPPAPIQENPILAKPVQEKHAQLNTNQSNTKGSNTDPSIYPGNTRESPVSDENAPADTTQAYRGLIRENIEYDVLASRYGTQRVDEIVELMLESVLSRRPMIRIAGDDFPRAVVGSRFLKLRADHIEYVFDCLDRNTTEIRNIKAYLLAALYNAPATMESYYRAEVNHDLHDTECGERPAPRKKHTTINENAAVKGRRFAF